MKNGILIGLALGMVTGALLVNNNYMARRIVDDTQRKVQTKMKERCHGVMLDVEAAVDNDMNNAQEQTSSDN